MYDRSWWTISRAASAPSTLSRSDASFAREKRMCGKARGHICETNYIRNNPFPARTVSCPCLEPVGVLYVCRSFAALNLTASGVRLPRALYPDRPWLVPVEDVVDITSRRLQRLLRPERWDVLVACVVRHSMFLNYPSVRSASTLDASRSRTKTSN